jgi:hypothetical protein
LFAPPRRRRRRRRKWRRRSSARGHSLGARQASAALRAMPDNWDSPEGGWGYYDNGEE